MRLTLTAPSPAERDAPQAEPRIPSEMLVVGEGPAAGRGRLKGPGVDETTVSGQDPLLLITVFNIRDKW